MKINHATINYALYVLNAQREFCKTEGAKQEAFYRGMKNMLEMIISDAYSGDAYLAIDNDGKHKIITKEAGKALNGGE